MVIKNTIVLQILQISHNKSHSKSIYLLLTSSTLRRRLFGCTASGTTGLQLFA